MQPERKNENPFLLLTRLIITLSCNATLQYALTPCVWDLYEGDVNIENKKKKYLENHLTQMCVAASSGVPRNFVRFGGSFNKFR